MRQRPKTLGCTSLLTLLAALLVAPAAEAASVARQCRKACRDEIAACVGAGGRARACRKSMLGRCKQAGVAVCEDQAGPFAGALAGDCTSPTVIPASGGTFSGTTSGTSALAGSCGSSGTSPERVFQWTPAVSGTATIQTCGAATTYDTVLYLRSGTCASGPEVAAGCNDDACVNASGLYRASRLTPAVTAGQTYYIVVDGYGGAQGTFSLTVTPPLPTTTTTTLPRSGGCSSPIVLPASGGTFGGTTSGTSALAGSCGSSGTSPEQVFQWTPAVSGTATIQTCGAATNFDTVLYLRSGACASGPEVAAGCNDDACVNASGLYRASRLTPAVTAGQTYYIVVDGYGGAQGTFGLTVVPPVLSATTTTTRPPTTTTTSTSTTTRPPTTTTPTTTRPPTTTTTTTTTRPPTTTTTIPSGTADEIHWTITGQTSVSVDWRGSATVIRYGLTSAYGQSVTGQTPSIVPFSSSGPFWEARITGLQENTVYHYSVGRGSDHTFRTPPPRGSAGFTVYAEGDIGASTSYSAVAPIQAMIAAGRPNFVLALGDLTYANANGLADVDQHYNDVMAWSQDAAYEVVWGNHEWDGPGDDLRNYKGRFDFANPQTDPAAPSISCCGEDWHWFDYGNTRFIAYPEPWDDWGHWFSLMSNTSGTGIMDRAQADPNIRFIVTFGHRPAWSTGVHPGDTTLAGYTSTLHATHSKYVLNLNGHSHDYERSDPSLTGGVIHVTSGAAGAELENVNASGCLWQVCPPPAWSVKRYMHFGVVKLVFGSTSISGQFICGPAGGGTNDMTCNSGDVMDSFTIQ